jgi:hypothetical protein
MAPLQEESCDLEVTLEKRESVGTPAEVIAEMEEAGILVEPSPHRGDVTLGNRGQELVRRSRHRFRGAGTRELESSCPGARGEDAAGGEDGGLEESASGSHGQGLLCSAAGVCRRRVQRRQFAGSRTSSPTPGFDVTTLESLKRPVQ